MSMENQWFETVTRLRALSIRMWEASKVLAELGFDRKVEALLRDEEVAVVRGWCEDLELVLRELRSPTANSSKNMATTDVPGMPERTEPSSH